MKLKPTVDVFGFHTFNIDYTIIRCIEGNTPIHLDGAHSIPINKSWRSQDTDMVREIADNLIKFADAMDTLKKMDEVMAENTLLKRAGHEKEYPQS